MCRTVSTITNKKSLYIETHALNRFLPNSYRNFRGDSNTVGAVISQATYALCWNAFAKYCYPLF